MVVRVIRACHKTVPGCQQDIQCKMIKLYWDTTMSHCASSVINMCLQQCTSKFTVHAHTTSQHPVLPVFKINVKNRRATWLQSAKEWWYMFSGFMEIINPGKTVRALLKSCSEMTKQGPQTDLVSRPKKMVSKLRSKRQKMKWPWLLSMPPLWVLLFLKMCTCTYFLRRDLVTLMTIMVH